MTPKEKADKLMDRMLSYQVVHQYDEDGEFRKRAKQCALIAVDELIQEECSRFDEAMFVAGVKPYWQLVKEEIEKL